MGIMDLILRCLVFLLGLSLVIATFSSALSTFVVPRSVRSQLNRLVFGVVRRVFQLRLNVLHTYEGRDALMAYYAPLGLVLLVPTWYVLVALGYAGMYWALGAGGWQASFRLSGSSLLTLGISASDDFLINLVVFSESTLGLTLVALLIAYLPTMYAAFSRREQAVNLLEVRAGNPPSAVEMILRFNRIHGLDRLNEYWVNWEAWFADLEESHTVLPALVFFRSPRPHNSWITSAGTVLDAAALTLAAVDIPRSAAAQLAIRAGYIALQQIVDYYEIPYPKKPSFPQDPISIRREEFDDALNRLAAGNVCLKEDRDQAWRDYAGWRVNYDVVLLVLCSLTMAPEAPWSSDRAKRLNLPPLLVSKKKRDHHRVP
jgi:hypothetical protein